LRIVIGITGASGVIYAQRLLENLDGVTQLGDTTSLLATTLTAAEQLAAVQASAPTALIGDRGYHSNDTLLTLHALGLRSYLAEPDRGRRCWTKEPEAQQPVYSNRRRVGSPRGQQLMRRRGEYVERTFAHVYDTGGLRRIYLRGHPNILKRLIVHAGAFNLGLLMRRVFGRGTPRCLPGRRQLWDLLWLALSSLLAALWPTHTRRLGAPRPLIRSDFSSFLLAPTGFSAAFTAAAVVALATAVLGSTITRARP
jgi:transposase